MILVFLLGASAYVGWNIGANDTANCVGTTVGCGLISYKRAVILISVFVLLGAMIDGGHVMKTIGKGIINQPLDYLAIFVALMCSGIFVTLATFFRIPTSTSTESKVDGLSWDLTKDIFTSDLEYSHKLHLKICLDHITDVSDKAEYAADFLEIVALKAMI